MNIGLNSLPSQALLFTSSTVFCAASVFAACDISNQAPHIGFSYSRIDDFKVQSSTPYDVHAISTQLSWRGRHWHVNHDYLALDLASSNNEIPVTNGDLHVLSAGYREIVDLNESGNLHWEVVPTLAASSNLLKNPEELEAGSFRFDGHLVWEVQANQAWSLTGGFCLSALSGEHEIIPVIGFVHDNSRVEITVGFPQSTFQYHAGHAITLYSDWALVGNVWEVLDKQLQNRSNVNLEAQRVKLGFGLNIPTIGKIDVYWLHLFKQETDYLARNGSRISADADDTNGWMIRYVYLL